jgi:hypothetical protein
VSRRGSNRREWGTGASGRRGVQRGMPAGVRLPAHVVCEQERGLAAGGDRVRKAGAPRRGAEGPERLAPITVVCTIEFFVRVRDGYRVTASGSGHHMSLRNRIRPPAQRPALQKRLRNSAAAISCAKPTTDGRRDPAARPRSVDTDAAASPAQPRTRVRLPSSPPHSEPPAGAPGVAGARSSRQCRGGAVPRSRRRSRTAAR